MENVFFALMLFGFLLPVFFVLWIVWRRQAKKDPQPASLRRASRGMALTILSFASLLVGGIGFGSTHVPTQEEIRAQQQADKEAAQAQDKAQAGARKAALDYWDAADGQIAFAMQSEDKAAAATDPVAMSEALKELDNHADVAFRVAGGTIHEYQGHDFSPPDDWDDVKDQLQDCAMHLQDFAKKARKGLDSGAPSDMADAKEEITQVEPALKKAMALARVHYQKLGGDPKAIQDHGALR